MIGFAFRVPGGTQGSAPTYKYWLACVSDYSLTIVLIVGVGGDALLCLHSLSQGLKQLSIHPHTLEHP